MHPAPAPAPPADQALNDGRPAEPAAIPPTTPPAAPAAAPAPAPQARPTGDPPTDPPRYTIAVRALCEFAAKRGDLDLRFTPSPSAQQGQEGHRLVARRRGPGWQAELPLQGRHGPLAVRGRADGVDLSRALLEEIKTHRGPLARQPDNHRALHWAQAEVYGWLLCQSAGLPALTLALVYLDIGTQQETRHERVLSAAQLRQRFEALCQRFLHWALAEAAHRQARQAALAALPWVKPGWRPGQRQLAEQAYHAARHGRVLLAQAPTGIGKTLGTLYPALKAMAAPAAPTPAGTPADTPTGTPTNTPDGALTVTPTAAPTSPTSAAGPAHPASPATPGLDKLLVLSAKGSGRQLAMDALAQLAPPGRGLPLRVLELSAQEHACVHPDKQCHGASCPLAAGFYDRLPAARRAAVGLPPEPVRPGDPQPPAPAMAAPTTPTNQNTPDTPTTPAAPATAPHPGPTPRTDVATLAAIAAAHQVCPYHLAHELVRWADVVVADYHHGFDPTAWLPGLAQAHGWRMAWLVDEVHNLVERGRDMHSVQLDGLTLQQARREARAPATAALKRPLEALRRAWRQAAQALDADDGADTMGDTMGDTPEDTAGGTPAPTYATAAELPAALLRALQDFSAAVSDWQMAQLQPHGQHQPQAQPQAQGQDPSQAPPPAPPPPAAPTPLPAALQALHFGALQFARLAELFGPHSVFERALPGVAPPGAGRGLLPPVGIRNILPGPLLAPRWAQAQGAVLFSATLAPPAFYAHQLGLPADHGFLDVPSPFDAAQLQVRIARHLSTRWGRRAASLPALADLIAAQQAQQPGNYLAFFSSFDYLAQAQQVLQQRHPGLTVWAQQRGMDAAARQAFLDRFREEGQGIGLAVLGGSFAEGVDLPGRRLIGAFVATLGLPQLNPVNEAMRRHLDAQQEDGYAAIYLYPGLRKVVQAAGRVIRAPEDRGTLWLIDDRYARAEVRALLPAWWQPVVAGPIR